MLPDIVVWRWVKKECVQHLTSEETSASIAELPAPKPTLPTVSGKKLTLSLPSTSKDL